MESRSDFGSKTALLSLYVPSRRARAQTRGLTIWTCCWLFATLSASAFALAAAPCTYADARFTVRIASMANRCFWVSPAELTVHVHTDGDCLQSHNNITIFTRQLQWALQECKKRLNNEPVEEQPQETHHHVQTVALHAANDAPQVDTVEEDQDDDSEAEIITKVEICTHSTNASATTHIAVG